MDPVTTFIRRVKRGRRPGAWPGVCGLVLTAALAATEMPTEPFSFQEDFEGGMSPVRFWATDGKYTVNFEGLTARPGCGGKQAYKLDVTFDEGSYFYWQIPVKASAEGALKFTGRILVEAESTGRASLGADVAFPPSDYTSCRSFGEIKKGDWRSVEEDLAGFGRERTGLPNILWGVRTGDSGVYVTKIGLFLYGGKGDRVVVYVDDLEVAGEVPVEDAYQKEIQRRWARVKERCAEKIAAWEKTLAENEAELISLNQLPPEAEKLRAGEMEKIAAFKRLVAEMKKTGLIRLAEQKEIDLSLERFPTLVHNLKTIASGQVNLKDMRLYVVDPISSTMILPTDTAIPGRIADEIELAACAGEYEAASFVVTALAPLAALTVTPSALEGKRGRIPAANLDVKVVKCWYQAGTAWVDISQSKMKRVLVPELLLNDDRLIKVDYEKRENYLKLGSRYEWISNPDEPNASSGYKMLSVEDYPVRDSPTLLPVDIAANRNQQFWITVKVPAEAQPGIYTGPIALSAGNEKLANLRVKLRVLPFELAEPYYTSSIYYRGTLDPSGKGSISSELKSEKQFRRELENLRAHGVTNPTVYQDFSGGLWDQALQIRAELGLDTDALYYIGASASSDPATIRKVLERAKAQGIAEVYFMGGDEATGDALTAQRAAWEATRRAGGKIFVAGYADSNFKWMGDIQDLLIYMGTPDKEEARKWHSVGHKIWSYANPQAGVENPEVYRRNFGLLLWQNNYDGACTYAYQHGWGNIWNDFDDPVYRDLVFAYPTVDGVIDTIAWEGYREGVDDVRYLTTLLKAIEEGKRASSGRIRKAAAEAERYLANLDVTSRCLDTVRLEMIDHILKVKGERR